MRHYKQLLYLLLPLCPTFSLAEIWIEAPAMEVTVTATPTIFACNISFDPVINLPDTNVSLFAVGGALNALTPTDYSGGDIYTPFNITLTNCGSETTPIPRTMRFMFRTTDAGPIIDGVFSDYLQNSTNVGIVIFNTDGTSARNVLLDEITFANQISTNSEQVFHFATRFQKVGNGESGIASGLYGTRVMVDAVYE
ncbi:MULTISPECIES: fimbrial protein [Citrobacter]|uniref:hypothetical protein n=1 Tax=Citrobacter TaxID=544 RepID=UPI00111CD60E|nr:MULTISPECIES: hypothetical protein [Citrobacter]EKX2182923.1 hypothetical protein [Citrobacter freundii]MBA7995458.1 hypothetical protein [Citrobacter freundii]MBJ8966519.1 hypothetical protein [Citrobacter freundii]MDV1634876.1 hypothetical protein [Citrobacter freundii]MDV1714611.1 hypothetical protein [Citrobacter freundii]